MQFLKLGTAAALPGISEHFLIWDLDMVPLRPLRLLWPPPPGAPPGAPSQVTNQAMAHPGGNEGWALPVCAPVSAVLVPHVGLLGVLVPCSAHVWLVPMLCRTS